MLAPGVRLSSLKSTELSLVSVPLGTRAADMLAPGGPEPKGVPSMNGLLGETAPQATASLRASAGSNRPTPPSSAMPELSEPCAVPVKLDPAITKKAPGERLSPDDPVQRVCGVEPVFDEYFSAQPARLTTQLPAL